MVCAESEQDDRPSETAIYAFSTPPEQVFATYIHKERKHRQRTEDISIKLSELEMAK